MSDPPSASQVHHRLRLHAHRGAFALDLLADLNAPWTILFGPSGSGKSTILRALCGLLTGASVSLTRAAEANPVEPGSPFASTSALPETELASLPIHQRALAYAPQQALLFPHLTIRDNVLFAARTGSPRRVSAEAAPHLQDRQQHHAPDRPRDLSEPDRPQDLSEQARELFQLEALWHRYPAQLSGGEQQRVNLARAFARPGARLLLLDEPFTGMDRALRDTILPRLRSALTARNLPVLSVTHDVEEAFLLEAEVLRLEAGKLLAQGSASRVLAGERAELLRTLG